VPAATSRPCIHRLSCITGLPRGDYHVIHTWLKSRREIPNLAYLSVVGLLEALINLGPGEVNYLCRVDYWQEPEEEEKRPNVFIQYIRTVRSFAGEYGTRCRRSGRHPQRKYNLWSFMVCESAKFAFNVVDFSTTSRRCFLYRNRF
jgi:hypothetical protein